MTPTPLDIMSYLTDGTFVTVVLLTLGVFTLLEIFERIGGRP